MQTGVVVLGHGSAVTKEANRVYFDLRDILRDKLGHDKVETALLIRAHGFPTIKEAVSKLVEQGITNIALTPAFISDGSHILKDIPIEVESLRLELPDISLVISESIGADPRIADILIDKIKKTGVTFD